MQLCACGWDAALCGDCRDKAAAAAPLRFEHRATCWQAIWADDTGCAHAVFPTSTKQTETISLEILSEICRAVDIPVVAIGGITATNAGQPRSMAVHAWHAGTH